MRNTKLATSLCNLFFLFISVFLSISVHATIYYVSSSGGNDNNNGRSTSSAWKTLGKVNSFRNLAPGDKILLKAGDTFEGPLKITTSGTQSSPIIIGKYDSGANPIILGNHPGSKWSAVKGHYGVFVSNEYGGSVKDVYDGNGTCYTQYKRGTQTLDNWLDDMPSNNWGYDVNLKTTYIKTASGSAPSVVHLFEFAVVECYKDYVIFENLDVRNGYIGIAAGGTGVIIRNNNISDVTQNGIYLTGAIRNQTSNNTITRTCETSLYLMKCQNSRINNNTITNNVGTILGLTFKPRRNPERCGIGAQWGNDNIVEHNNLSNIYNSFFDYWYESGTITRFNYGKDASAATTQGGSKLQLYGNIFNVNGNKGISAIYEYDLKKNPSAEEGEIIIYNNVINNFESYGLWSGSGKVTFRNNILKTKSKDAVFVSISTGTSCDYNSYYSSVALNRTGWGMGVGVGSRTGYKTIEEWRKAKGQDAHSFIADPKFVTSTPVSAEDFKLSSSSPCINKGQNLKIAGLVSLIYTDYTGTAPQGTATDIGAYEYSGDGTPSEEPETPSEETPNQAPKVTLTSPTANATYTAPASVRLTATASDADGSISKVEFYRGSTLILTEYNANYDMAWKNVLAGTYTITAKAYDNSGNVTTSAPATITVKASSLSMVAPSENELAMSAPTSEDLRISPNPATSNIFVDFAGSSNNQQAQLTIRNAAGSTVKTMPVTLSGNGVKVDISALAPGMYLLTVTGEGVNSTQKFLKVN